MKKFGVGASTLYHCLSKKEEVRCTFCEIDEGMARLNAHTTYTIVLATFCLENNTL